MVVLTVAENSKFVARSHQIAARMLSREDKVVIENLSEREK